MIKINLRMKKNTRNWSGKLIYIIILYSTVPSTPLGRPAGLKVSERNILKKKEQNRFVNCEESLVPKHIANHQKNERATFHIWCKKVCIMTRHNPWNRIKRTQHKPSKCSKNMCRILFAAYLPSSFCIIRRCCRLNVIYAT